jgi:hypothetical protein
MAAQTTAPSERFVFGPLVMRDYVLTSVANADTLTVPLARVLAVIIQPTTAQTVGYTLSGNVITLALGGTVAATVTVIGREG